MKIIYMLCFFTFREQKSNIIVWKPFLSKKCFHTRLDPVLWTIIGAYNILLAGNTDPNGSRGDTVQEKKLLPIYYFGRFSSFWRFEFSNIVLYFLLNSVTLPVTYPEFFFWADWYIHWTHHGWCQVWKC